MKKEIIRGVLQGNERGYAFLIPEEPKNYKEAFAAEGSAGEGDFYSKSASGETTKPSPKSALKSASRGEQAERKDYFVPHSELKGAMHGDTVLAETTETFGERGERGGRTTARVLKILERGINEVVGTYFSARSGGFVRPDDCKYFTDIFIPFGKGLRAKAGDKVVCRILAYPKKQSPEGIVSKILGRQFEKKAELASVLYEFKLREKFPLSVIEEAAALSEKISAKEIKKRRDFREETVFTIDGDDARDFDDAVSIEKTAEGYALGVHIADVSAFVKESGDIDEEAFERGTSVYFPEKVIPMLPERLCNDLCSLVEGKDRLTLSCLMKFDNCGRLIDREICPSVINSRARLTYSEVQSLINGTSLKEAKAQSVRQELLTMKELAEILRARRSEKGSVDLEVKDSEITVDKNGEIEVRAAEKDEAHGLIEEFMIAANCAVAEYAYYLSVPFVYRVHEKPTEERLVRFYDFLAGLGITARRNREGIYSSDFQKILNAAQGSAAFPLVNRVMLRTMQKARYSPLAEGHFGLAEEHYCHFTSPIRRYPDLVVHRILKYLIENGTENIEERFADVAENASVQASETEKNAEAAERAVDDYYKLLYISGKEGEDFEGVVSGVLNSGMFVELDCGVEGFVRAETLSGGRITCDRENYTLSDGKKTYRLGEKVLITVVGVNLVDRRAEFMLSEASETSGTRGQKINRKAKRERKKGASRKSDKKGKGEKWKKKR